MAESGNVISRAKLGSDKRLRIALSLIFVLLLLIAYSPSLVSPALLDEQFLLRWLGAAPKLHGSSGFAGFWNWSGFDGADGWGPVSKLFLLSAVFLTFKNVFLLKLTALFLHGICTLLTYLCSRKLFSGRAPAVFAALFFALQPLHFESVAWLGGIPSELATLFFLAAMLVYSRSANPGFGWFHAAFVAAFSALSFLSATFMWTSALAFAITGAVFALMPDEKASRKDLTMPLIAVLIPLLLSGVCLAAAGGLPSEMFPDFAVKNAASLLRRLFFSINEINWHRYSREYRNLFILYPLLAVFCLSGLILCRKVRRAVLLSSILLFILLVPVCGIAVKSSDLYGERWLYAATVPLCILLAAALAKLMDLTGRFKNWGIFAGVLTALLLSGFFFRHLYNENSAARNKARVLKFVQKSMKIIQERESLPLLIVRDLPEKLSVCPGYSPLGPAIFDPLTGLMRSCSLPDGRIKQALRMGKLRREFWRWEKALNCFLPLELSPTNSSWPQEMNLESFAAFFKPPLAYNNFIHFSPDGKELCLEPSSGQGPIIVASASELGTLDADYLALEAAIDAPPSLAAPRVELQWRTALDSDYDKRQRYSYANAFVNDGKAHRYLLSLRTNGWTSGGPPFLIALGFPPASRVRLSAVSLVRDAADIARLEPLAEELSAGWEKRFNPPSYNYPSDMELGLVSLGDGARSMAARYSVAHIKGACGASVELSIPDKNFDDANSNHLSGQTYKTFHLNGTDGRLEIPLGELPRAGVYSVRVIAVGNSGAYLGQFSDPLSYQIPRLPHRY